MGVLSLLTIDEVHDRTNITIVRDNSNLEFYIDLSEGILNEQGLDKTRGSYVINMGYAVLKLVEHLVIQDDEGILMALAGPFTQEKMGSYSYKLKEIEQLGWPPMVERMLKMYRSVPNAEDMVISSRVFEELRHTEATGFRPYHDLLDKKFHEWENENRPLP